MDAGVEQLGELTTNIRNKIRASTERWPATALAEHDDRAAEPPQTAEQKKDKGVATEKDSLDEKVHPHASQSARSAIVDWIHDFVGRGSQCLPTTKSLR